MPAGARWAEIASNGREAVEEYWERRFDVVLMDVQMPEVNGLDATRAIRERERRLGVRLPIVALTAHALSPGPSRRPSCLRLWSSSPRPESA
jgi:CheY-like chemotaxis protein